MIGLGSYFAMRNVRQSKKYTAFLSCIYRNIYIEAITGSKTLKAIKRRKQHWGSEDQEHENHRTGINIYVGRTTLKI